MPTDRPLEYAPGAPLRRRRRIRRIVFALTVLALTAAGWRWGPAGWRQAQFLYWQRQCMNYTMPAGSPPWETDPAKAPVLVRQNQDYIAPSRGWGWAVFYPRCLRECESRGLPRSLQTFEPPVLLLHELRSPSGNRRLVIVQGDQYAGLDTADPRYDLTYTIYVPAGFLSAPRKMGAGVRLGDPVVWHIDYALGQIDPADPSHFTINWKAGALTGVFDGRLTDDDRIVVTERKGPATQK